MDNKFENEFNKGNENKEKKENKENKENKKENINNNLPVYNEMSLEHLDNEANQIEFNDSFTEGLFKQSLMMAEVFKQLNQKAKYIKEIHKDMKVIQQKAEDAASKAEKALEEINNHVFLTQGEVNQIHDTIRTKSVEIARYLDSIDYFPDIDFPKIIGKVRSGLWTIVRKKFGVNSYKNIKHIDFEIALNIAEALNRNDYIRYAEAYNRYKK